MSEVLSDLNIEAKLALQELGIKDDDVTDAHLSIIDNYSRRVLNGDSCKCVDYEKCDAKRSNSTGLYRGQNCQKIKPLKFHLARVGS